MAFFNKSANKNDNNQAGNEVGEPQTDKWRGKYYDLLDAQDLSDKAHLEEQELLCKTIIKLAIVASGFDNELEPHLLRIRNHLKGGLKSDQLKAELDQLTDVLIKISVPAGGRTGLETIGQRPSSHEVDPTDVELLFDFLLHYYTLDSQQSALLSLKQRCRPFVPEPKQLFADIIGIIDIRTPPNPSGEIFSGQVLAQAIDASLINKQLLHLLEQIEVPDTFGLKALALKQRLNEPSPDISAEALLDDVIALLIEINADSQPKQQEIDKFLAAISEQLTELGMAVTGSTMAVMDASADRSKLDESVTGQIQELQQRSMTATQLEPLKAVISSRIAVITKEIQEHKNKEEAQREKAQRQLDELSHKIAAMESEAGDLKAKLVTVSIHATRDALTNLPNRLAYESCLKMEFARWQRYQTPLCLVVWDIDYFKKVNDFYGHQAGDKVLVHIAKQFTENARKSDFIGRFGGEEFVMLLPDTNRQSAFKLAHKLRFIIEQSRVQFNLETLAVTISCGITQFLDGDTNETAFARADQALYQAKELGRNQCCMA
jgi:diguanylate cyclase